MYCAILWAEEKDIRQVGLECIQHAAIPGQGNDIMAEEIENGVEEIGELREGIDDLIQTIKREDTDTPLSLLGFDLIYGNGNPVGSGQGSHESLATHTCSWSEANGVRPRFTKRR